MPKSNLPTVNLILNEVNEDWSRDKDPSMFTYTTPQYFVCEVLTLHLTKNTMRIRYQHRGKNETRDVDATPFFDKFEITSK